MMWNTHIRVQPRIRNSEKEAKRLPSRCPYPDNHISTLPPFLSLYMPILKVKTKNLASLIKKPIVLLVTGKRALPIKYITIIGEKGKAIVKDRQDKRKDLF